MGWLFIMWKEHVCFSAAYINRPQLSVLILTIGARADPSPLFKSTMKSTRIMKIEFNANVL